METLNFFLSLLALILIGWVMSSVVDAVGGAVQFFRDT